MHKKRNVNQEITSTHCGKSMHNWTLLQWPIFTINIVLGYIMLFRLGKQHWVASGLVKATIYKSRSQSLSFYSQKFAILPAKTCNKVTWKLRKTHKNEKLLLRDSEIFWNDPQMSNRWLLNDSQITTGSLSDNFLMTIVSRIPREKTN